MKSFGALLLLLPLLVACAPDDSSQALGTLERDRVTFSATSNEIIRALPVKEGSQVKIGDVLVRLDTTSQQAMLAQAIAQQAKANAYLTKLTNGERPEDIAVAQAKVTLATAKLTEANKNYRRKAELVSKNLISESEKDTALSARDSARAELDSAKEEFAKLTAGKAEEGQGRYHHHDVARQLSAQTINRNQCARQNKQRQRDNPDFPGIHNMPPTLFERGSLNFNRVVGNRERIVSCAHNKPLGYFVRSA